MHAVSAHMRSSWRVAMLWPSSAAEARALLNCSVPWPLQLVMGRFGGNLYGIILGVASCAGLCERTVDVAKRKLSEWGMCRRHSPTAANRRRGGAFVAPFCYRGVYCVICGFAVEQSVMLADVGCCVMFRATEPPWRVG